ncbi:MAG: acetoin utilization protein AcuC [Candidatus Bipolaricaulota bacterium]|nr:acetoin utilization protein AcuC [Candidatus Bipolaricaulota bacterium]
MKKTLVDPRQLLRFDFGDAHPFKVYRLGLFFDLCGQYGLVERPDVDVVPLREATEAEALWFHSQGYLEALRLASSGMWVPNQFAHGLGTTDNPIFPDVYEWATLIAGGSIAGAEALLHGATRAFNPAGGLHHAMPTRASGFCHINDGVLAIERLRQAGKRVVYVDIDAHHGDGVQHAFYRARDVLTVSIHQTGYTIFPGTGFEEEIGADDGRGLSVNIPLLPGAGDRAYDLAFDELILPAIELFGPDVLVTQLGTDALIGDLLANLRMSLHGFERAVERFRALGVPWLALGGGGYDVGNVLRAWALAWGVMLDEKLPDEIPSLFLTEAAAHGVTVSQLRGPREVPPTSDRVLEALDETIRKVRESTFPILSESRKTS